MALKLTLPKEVNPIGVDFVDAYWVVEDVGYTVDKIGFSLVCYPNRECSKIKGAQITQHFTVGAPYSDEYKPMLYLWNCETRVEFVFPNGVPLGRDAQLTSIYNWIKAYTQLPFEDILEEEEDQN